MSNVLIGIIGVILFIGLALAGALFLGPRFQESTNSSKATAAVQAVTQIARAAQLATAQTGEPVSSANHSTILTSILVSDGYMKSIPANPVATTGPGLVQANGAFDGSGIATAAVMRLGNDERARSICEAIIKQTGNGSTSISRGLTPVEADGITGCYRISGPNGNIGAVTGDYVTFAKI